MKTIKILSLYCIIALFFFRCEDPEMVGPDSSLTSGTQLDTQAAAMVASQYQVGSTYYVGTSGNDASGDGTSGKPWRSLKFAVSKVAAGQGHTIKLGAGTFVESGLIEVPLGVNIEGAGKTLTILKAASTFYYNPTSPSYATEKFLISLNGYNPANGNQILKNFTIDGDGKKLHGGIYVKYRNNVIIDQVKIQYTNFTGMWLWDVKNSQVINTDFLNCSWGSTGYCVGALNLGNIENVEVANVDINESTGYGIKAIGPSGYNNITKLKIHDSRVSVHPYGLWNNGSAPNIAIELWQVNLVGCEIYNTYVDNTISLVNSNAIPSTGVQTIRVHHNTIDMETRSGGSGYGVELTVHDAEVDHNYFLKGTYGIANWDNPMKNWSIHHNVFYALQGQYPGEVVRSQWSGLHNVKLYNNTIEFAGNKTMNVVGVYGGTSENIEVKNNLVINSNTGYSYYQNKLVHRENGAVINNMQIQNNLFNNLDLNVSGLLSLAAGVLDGSLKNLTGDPKINKTGVRPEPYYMPATGSPLINAGINMGFTYSGTAPDIGAFESGSTASVGPQVSLTSPTNNSNFATGTTINLTASASDADGSVSKVEFFRGAIKLGEDTSSPYSCTWTNAAAGTHAFTAKATDNTGIAKTSSVVSVTVAATSTANKAPIVSLTSPANNSTFTTGSSVNISASASDSDGAIAKVEFYNGSTKLGEDLSSPYSFVISNATASSYSISARAIDNKGAVATSTTAVITSNSSSSPSPSIIQVELDASKATMSGNMTLLNDAQAGSYFTVPAGNGRNYYIPAPSSATYNFQAPKATNYVMWVRVKAPTTNNQGFYIYDGKGRWTTWQAGVRSQWTWVKVTDAYNGSVVNFSLVQGSNSIQFGWFDDNVQVDKILLTDNASYTPN